MKSNGQLKALGPLEENDADADDDEDEDEEEALEPEKDEDELVAAFRKAEIA